MVKFEKSDSSSTPVVACREILKAFDEIILRHKLSDKEFFQAIISTLYMTLTKFKEDAVHHYLDMVHSLSFAVIPPEDNISFMDQLNVNRQIVSALIREESEIRITKPVGKLLDD